MQIRTAVVLGVLSTSAGTAVADSTSTIGAPANLVAGAEALQFGRFEEGVSLTEAGLGDAVTSEQRAAALSNLCAGYTALGRYDIAIVRCSESLEIESGGWQAYNNRALAYLGKGLVALARRDVLEGLRLNPDATRLLRVQAMVEEAARRQSPSGADDPVA